MFFALGISFAFSNCLPIPWGLIDASVIGAHVATLPPKVIHELYKHPLTDKGLKAFLDDWAKTGQQILPK